MWPFIADLIAAVHVVVVFVVFAGVGILLFGRVRDYGLWSRIAFAIAVVGTALSDAIFGECILTRLEKMALDRAAPGSAYHGSFVVHGAEKIARAIASLPNLERRITWTGLTLAVFFVFYMLVRRAGPGTDDDH